MAKSKITTSNNCSQNAKLKIEQHLTHWIKTLEKPKGQSNMDNPEKLETRRRQTNKKHNTICVGHHHT